MGRDFSGGTADGGGAVVAGWEQGRGVPFILGYIHNGTVHAPFMHSMLALQRDMGDAFQAVEAPGVFLAANRSRVVDYFLDATKSDWLLFVDTDVAFTPEHVYRLLEYGDDAHQIVAGLCFTWLGLPDGSKALGPNWWNVDSEGHSAVVSEIRQDVLNPITYCGMAFTLLGRDVLAAVRAANRESVATTTFAHEPVWMDGRITLAGEDMSLCLRAVREGFACWGAGDVIVDHYKTHPVGLNMMQALYGDKS